MKLTTHLLCILAGLIAGYSYRACQESTSVDGKPTIPQSNQAPHAPVHTNGTRRLESVSPELSDVHMQVVTMDQDTLTLAIPRDVLSNFSRYLRVAPLGRGSLFEPSEDLSRLFSLSTGELAAVKQALAGAFDEMSEREAAVAKKVSDSEKGEYWEIPSLASAADMKTRFITSLQMELGEARAVALGSILSNSGILAEFGSFPREMYLEEKVGDAGGRYFMLTQRRVADGPNQGIRDYGSQSTFIPDSDIERRFGRLYDAAGVAR